MQHIRILLLVSLWTHFLSPNHLLGQIKYEKEYDIEQKEVPRIALEFITKSGFEKHVRWYREESQDGTTIEAKSKKNRHKYSIEFDTSGKLLDIEKTVKMLELCAGVHAAAATFNYWLSSILKQRTDRCLSDQNELGFLSNSHVS